MTAGTSPSTEATTRIASLEREGIVRFMPRVARYYDEPPLPRRLAQAHPLDDAAPTGWGVGVGAEPEIAFVRAGCEALERMCLAAVPPGLLRAPADGLGRDAVRAGCFSGFSPEQLSGAAFAPFRVDDTVEIEWVEARSLHDGREVFLPADTVYVPYGDGQQPMVRHPVSTGAATALDWDTAVLKGLLEVIERDAFTIHYLQDSGGRALRVGDDPELCELTELFSAYRLEARLVLLPTDVAAYVVLALLLDHSGVGPAVSAGLSCGLEPRAAAYDALTEAWQTRPWLRDLMFRQTRSAEQQHGEEAAGIFERGLMWSDTRMLTLLDSWPSEGPQVQIDELSDHGTGCAVEDARRLFEQLGTVDAEAFAVDLTHPAIAGSFVVAKVVVPGLQPLHLDGRLPYLGGRRLYELLPRLGLAARATEAQLNPTPHFFL